MTSDGKPSWDELREQAADWLAGMDTGTADRDAFEAWRSADPRHAAAFVQVAHAARTLDRVKPGLKAAIPPVRPISRRSWLIGGTAVVATAVAGGGYAVATAKATIATKIGEQKAVHLPTGGTIYVNTNSKVQWRMHKGVLEVSLKAGEIALDLSGTSEPCHLFAADRMAEFTGGKINARLRGGLLDLAVVSGHCTLSGAKAAAIAGSGPQSATIVLARHAVLAGSGQSAVRPLSALDTIALDAWPQGELVFEGQSLETIVAEYNRYLSHKIIIADPSLAGLRLGGRFTTHDPSAFLKALHDGFGIVVINDGAGGVVLIK